MASSPITIEVRPLPSSEPDQRLSQPIAIPSVWDEPIAPNAPKQSPKLFTRRTSAFAGAAIATVAGAGVVQLANQPTTYEGKVQLQVEPDGAAAAHTQTPAPTQTTPTVDYATQIQILWSPKLLAPVAQQLQHQYADLTYDALAQKLDITHQDGAKTLEISYQDTDPQKVQAVLTQVSHAYVEYSKTCRTRLCNELAFVERRLPQLQKQLTVAQRNLQAWQQRHGITEPEALGQQLSQRRGILAQQQQDLQIELTATRTQVAVLQRRLATPTDATRATQLLNQNARYQSLMAQVQTIAQQLATELAQPQPDRPTLQSLQQQYQQVSAQATQAAQQPFVQQVSQAIAQYQTTDGTDYSAVVRQQALLEWVTTTNQLRLQDISQQAITQADAQIAQQIKQWAGLAREYAELNLERQFASDNLTLYQTRQAKLQQIIKPNTAWQQTAPAVETASQGLSASEKDLTLALLVSFLLVVWALGIIQQLKPRHRPWSVPHLPSYPADAWSELVIPDQPEVSTQPVPALAYLPQHDRTHQQAAFFLLAAATRINRVKPLPQAA